MSLDAALASPFLRRAFWTTVWTVNLVLAGITIVGFFVSDVGYDWAIFMEAGERIIRDGLFDWEGQYTWNYSPIAAYAFTVLAPIGFIGWSAMHFAAVAALADRRLIAITLLSWPFWADVYNGNTMVFVFVAAVGAVRGRWVATGLYMALFLLMPRPLTLPVLAWILWRRPAWRVPFLLMAVAHAALVLFTGLGPAWIDVLVGLPEAVAASSRDLGPGNLIGGWWLVVGGLLAVLLTVRGRLGLASIAASPYWLPQYLLMVLLEAVPKASEKRQSRQRRQGTSGETATTDQSPTPMSPSERDQQAEAATGNESRLGPFMRRAVEWARSRASPSPPGPQDCPAGDLAPEARAAADSSSVRAPN